MMKSDRGAPARRASIIVVAATEGRSVHLDKLLPSLVKFGMRPQFLGWDRERSLPRRFERDGVRFEMVFGGWGYANWRLALAVPLWMARVLRCLLKGPRDVLVMAIDFDTGLPAAIAHKLTGRPFVYNVRDNYAMRLVVPSFVRGCIDRLDRWISTRASAVIVPDEGRIPEDIPVSANYVVIRNCALEVQLCPTVEARPFTVYAMGYLRESRGIGLLLDVASSLPDIRVLVAGQCPEAGLDARLRSTPMVDYRGFLPVESALQLLSESDVVFTFYSPDSEINRRAISNKWSDAMMAAKPIVVNSEVLRSAWIVGEDIGYSCAYNDVDALRNLLCQIRSDPADARRKGENGRRLFEAGFSWAAMEQHLEALLIEVAGRPTKQA